MFYNRFRCGQSTSHEVGKIEEIKKGPSAFNRILTELKEKIDHGAQLLDVRTVEEFDAGYARVLCTFHSPCSRISLESFISLKQAHILF
jgi:hypothetical protein